MKRDREFYREIGRKGGMATVERHGREHMSQIGRKGYQVTTCRHFLGNDRWHNEYLSEVGAHVYWRQSGLAMKYDANGNPIWPEEMPVHPAHTAAPGQTALFENEHLERWEEMPW